MSSIVFSCHVQHATPQIINPFSPHLEFITHDLRSTRTVIYNFVSANHLMGSLSPMFILPRNSPYTHYSHRVSQFPYIKDRGGGGICLCLIYRLAPMWQQSGTLLFCSCHGIAGFLVDELQI